MSSLAATALVAAVLAAACVPVAGDPGGVSAPQPRQGEATAIVMRAFSAGTGRDFGVDAPAAVAWRFGDTCGDADGDEGRPRAFWGDGECLFGHWEQVDDVATVEWNGSFSAQQTFAHELAHAAAYETTGNCDAGHASQYFNAPGGGYDGSAPPGSYVYAASEALAAAGL